MGIVVGIFKIWIFEFFIFFLFQIRSDFIDTFFPLFFLRLGENRRHYLVLAMGQSRVHMAFRGFSEQPLHRLSYQAGGNAVHIQ